MGHKAGKIALGLGLITGALTGLLFAPDEGKNIRKKIAKGDTKALLNDLLSMGEEMKNMLVDFASSPSIHDALEAAKDKAAEVANIKREELDSMLRKANRKAEQFKKMVARYVKEQKGILNERYGKRARKGVKTSAKQSVRKSPSKKSAKKANKKSSVKKRSRP